MRSLVCCFALLTTICFPALAEDAPWTCADTPEPVVSLNYVSRYVDGDAERATIDPLLEAEAETAVAPVDSFILTLAEGIDAMYSQPVKDRPEIADCILRQMGGWASADALSDLRTETVRLTVGARYAAFALMLWQTRPYAFDHPARTDISAWLDRRIREQIAFWVDAPDGARIGNLRAWAGLAAAALSVQTGDAQIRDWAEQSITDVLCSANPDGSLPQEMSRGRLALHYQLHAVAPLVTATALFEREGMAVSEACNNALHRIVSFAMSDLKNGEKTRKITGSPQNLFDGSDTLERFQLAWVEPYLTLKYDAALDAFAADMRPFSYSKLGGNQTALWGQ